MLIGVGGELVGINSQKIRRFKPMKKKFSIFLCCVFVFSCIMAVTANAQMQTPDVMMTRFMPTVEKELAASFDDEENLVVNYEDTSIALPVNDNVLSIAIETEDNEAVLLEIALPMQEENISVINDNTAYYDNTNDGFIQTIQVYDKDILISTSALNASAPVEYVYNFNLSENTYMDYLYDEETSKPIDDTIYVFDNSGKILYSVAVNDVRTVDGEKVESELALNGEDVILTINNGEALDKAVTFSVQASGSYSFSHYFNSESDFDSYWEDHTGQYEFVLRLYPNFNNLYSPYTRPDNVTHRDGSWSTVYNKFYTDTAHWKNTAGLKDQYLCHYNYTQNKSPWNIEPWRPNVGYNKTVAASCNPK